MAGAQTTFASSSIYSLPLTAPPARKWTYDAFLSFRGEDVRKSFVDHLYAALDRAGIYTFKDDKKLRRGKLISPELSKAIEESMVALVVFSKNYANSSWCLDELAKIIECRALMGQRVLPVFYDVDPSDVRGQKRSFHTAFQQHEVESINNMDKVKRWRKALITAANLSGWDVPKTASGHEAECIKQIVSNILSYTESHQADNLIGMNSRVKDVKSLLGKGLGEVRIIGISGMGGIGKTTLARAVFRQISYEFEGSSFLEDVRDNGSDKRGLKSLQEKLLSEILMEEHFKVKDCDDGICQIRRRLRHKKVLLVLDDVDDDKQLEFLAGAHEWFGRGSRIIITTRDEHMLSCAHEKYAPGFLNDRQAMSLFSRYAFKANNPPQAYEKLSAAVVLRTGRLPLALKILGCHFCGRNLDFWQSALKVLATKPENKIMGVLKLSFDGLNDLEKKIFLDIACFFKGKKRDHVTTVLDSFGFEPISGITVLVEKSLLTISKGNLYMHDLIQEMAWCIVRECYSNNRVWLQEEIKEVMTTINRLETVEAIVEKYDYYPHNFEDRCKPFCNAQVFKSMKKLRLLTVYGRFTSNKPTYFPEQLGWLHWTLYPFESLNITEDTSKLVGLEMPRARMKQLQMDKKIILSSLKFMNLKASSIERFPDISGLPNLELLNLSSCQCLVEVHQSVGLHKRLTHLDLSDCKKLEILPSSIHMKSLQTLSLSNCIRLRRFPGVSGEMGRLFVLHLDGFNKKITLPSSAGLDISTSGNSPTLLNAADDELEQHYSNIIRLRSLRILDLSRNYRVEVGFPCHLHDAWPFLEELYLNQNMFTQLPASISRLSRLKYLDLSKCINLEELHELPSLIQVLKADYCKSLQKIGDFSNKYKWLFHITLHGCPKLLKDEHSLIHLESMLMKSFIQKCAAVNRRLSIELPETKIPSWFSNQQLGDTIALEVPQNQTTKAIGLAICCCFRSSPSGEYDRLLKIKFNEKFFYKPTSVVSREDHLWIGYMSFDFLSNLDIDFGSRDNVISFDTDDHYVSECAVCVIFEDDVKPTTRIRSCIQDYEESEHFRCGSASCEDLQQQRGFIPTFSFDYEDHRTVKVRL